MSSTFGGKADIIQGKADIKKCLLMTQSGHRFNVGHFSLHDPVTDNRSHGTSAVPESYLVSHLANETSKEGRALVGRRNAAMATC